MRSVIRFLTTLVLGLSVSSHADQLVLIHGYQSDASTWVTGGVVDRLAAQGWTPGGLLTPLGPTSGATQLRGKRLLLAELPSEAPLAIQAGELSRGLRALRRTAADERLILVGHSAGGVVARMALVTDPELARNALLITIASPHLGTVRAAEALNATAVPFPVSWAADMLGGPRYRSLKRSWQLLTELAMTPGSALDWLNRQTHPQARYVSVVRSTPGSIWGDALVPGYSQDMNYVPALRGRSQRVVVSGPHGLVPADGTTLTRILAEL